eukprot:jgi/Hompol1/6487/HPOL_000777-RA
MQGTTATSAAAVGSFLLTKNSKQASKKTKPVQTKGAPFVSKILANEQLAKMLGSRPPDTSYLFFNAGKSFIWADCAQPPAGLQVKARNFLSIIQFKDAYVTCHDINMLTRETMDSVLGFSTGDIMWYSPISGKFARMNRSGAIHKHAVTSIKWLPGSESLFMAGFDDGSIFIFDKELDDQAFSLPNTSDDFMIVRIAKPKCNPTSYWKSAKKAITGK